MDLRRQMQRRPIALGKEEVVRLAPLALGQELPLVATPATEHVDLAAWAQSERQRMDALLVRHGAVLLRGFGLRSSADFSTAATALCETLYGDYGDLPREAAGSKIYGATPYPASLPILFHNESSHLPTWPTKQLFFCAQPATTGGATPLVDCAALYRALEPALRERFERLGLIYVRNFIPGLDVSWQHFFGTQSRERVAQLCQRAGARCEWTPTGLRTCQPAPAVRRHPRTGELLFFNQLQLHHPRAMDPATRDSLRALFVEPDFPRYVTFGDGSPIEDAVIDALIELCFSRAQSFDWQAGDLLMVDNMRCAHARLPYEGPRRILVAMGDMHKAPQDLP